MLEVEIKVRADIDLLEQQLIHLGFTRQTAVYEYDTYYNGKTLDLKAADKALRVREHKDLDTGETCFLLNFKGPKLDQTTMTREETEFEVPSHAHAETLLNGLGFYVAGTVEKTRLYYVRDDITCCLDQVTGLGEFLEVEILTGEDGYDSAIRRIRELLAGWNLDLKDTIRRSYLSMLAQ